MFVSGQKALQKKGNLRRGFDQFRSVCMPRRTVRVNKIGTVQLFRKKCLPTPSLKYISVGNTSLGNTFYVLKRRLGLQIFLESRVVRSTLMAHANVTKE